MKMIKHSKPWISSADIDAVGSVLRSNMISRGEMVSSFNASLTKFLGMKNGVVLSSGSAALAFALRALGVHEGCEVILPTYVCHQVYDAVVQVGGTPILCDVGQNWTITAETVEPCLSSQTAAIIVVHIFGIVADVNSIGRFGIPIIEDCCQAFGAGGDGLLAGNLGDIGIYSFNAIKCLTTGEGGFVGTSSRILGEKMDDLKNKSEFLSPMSDLQAALGLSQLERYSDFMERRRQLAFKYFKKLPPVLTAHMQSSRKQSMFFRFLLDSDLDFDIVQERFSQLGIAVRQGVDDLLHRRINLPDASFPNAVSHYLRTLSIPIYPALEDDEQADVIQAIYDIFEGK